MLCNPVVLGCVRSSDLVLDPAFIEIVHDVSGHVLASSIGMKCLDLLTSFAFCPSDEGFE
jgi:hypothetical protein